MQEERWGEGGHGGRGKGERAGPEKSSLPTHTHPKARVIIGFWEGVSRQHSRDGVPLGRVCIPQGHSLSNSQQGQL